MLNFLASMTTPRKEAASQPTTAVQIQLSPDMSDEESTALAQTIWSEINEANLHDNILPTKKRADLILTKGSHHTIDRIRLRKL